MSGPIAVFDSGVGGLTVLRALRARLPRADFIYLGDTARLPYGTKSPATIERYALQAAAVLRREPVRALVVACNTASAVALQALRALHSDIPVVGVVEPGAAAACAHADWSEVAVIATESTIRGGAYQQAIARLRPDMRVRARACSVFVALAEEGWFDTPATRAVVEQYLGDWLVGVDGLVLGCTHFPVFAPLLESLYGDRVGLVDSATTTADLVAKELGETVVGMGQVRFLATDGAERFAEVGSRFLGLPLSASQVEIVDL